MYNPIANPYNPYMDQYNRPYQPIASNPVPQPDTNMIWVQGESGAKAYPVQNGKSVVLFDSENERFFIKSADISGMPQPLRVFNYSEAAKDENKPADTSAFVTRDEFEEAMKELKQGFLRKENKPNGKPVVQ